MHKPYTILVVDPDERSYKTFDSVLGIKNRVLFVPNGKTALDLPDSQAIDMAFISHILNRTSGIELLESFKQRYPSIPVILIAEQPKVDDVISAYRSGARELLLKPIDEDELVAITTKISGFVSYQKPKRRWFFPVKKRIRTNDSAKNNCANQKQTSQNGEHMNGVTVVEYENSQAKESTPMANVVNNQLKHDAPLKSAQLDAETHTLSQKDLAHPLIEAFFFGPFRVLVNNQSIENWPSKKGKSIFAYLLLHHKRKVFRDVLMDLLWQKSSPDSARNCLNVSIHGLRRALQDIDPHNDYILFKDECYYFNPELEIRLDVDAFRSIWRKARSTEHRVNLPAAVSEYERALTLYRGDFLEDELYDGWSSLDKENLKEVYLVILDKISENLMHQNDHRKAIRVCEQILEKDNCREDIYRRLMVCYYRAGQRDKSLRLFRKCTRVLKD
ncbi:MAG: BTAD domain-containing putative transcriptional regulator, partial [Desulfobacterales bacterium]